MTPTLIIVRHPDTPMNSDDKGEQQLRGQLPLQLTDKGKQQAAAMAKTLANENIRAVYSSDLPQAMFGAKAIAAANRGKPEVIPTKALRSWNVGTELAGKKVKDVLPTLTQYQLKLPDTAPTGGEAFNARLKQWFEIVRGQMKEVRESPNEGAIVDETHGRFLTALVGWLDKGMKGIEVDPVVWEKSVSPVENGDALVLTFEGLNWKQTKLKAGEAR